MPQTNTQHGHTLMVIPDNIHQSTSLLRHSRTAVDGILRSVQEKQLHISFKLSGAAASVNELMAKYADVPADFADACLIHMADELDTGDILTLDSDFKHYRWRRNRAFRLLIPLE